MRRWLHVGVASMAVALIGGVLVAGPASGSAPKSGSKAVSRVSRAEHYAASTTSAPVCSAAVVAAHSTGAAMCVDDTSAPAAPGPDAMPAATPEHCDVWGCWYRYSGTHVEYISTAFGVIDSGEIIGDGYMHVVWLLNGAQTTQSSSERVTIETEYPVWSGSLFNGGHNQVGSDLADCNNADGPDDVPANDEVHSPAGWCTLTDTNYINHNMVNQYSFQVPGIDGYFWMYAKSVVSSTSSVPSSSYTFDSVDTLPGNVADSGYDG